MMNDAECLQQYAARGAEDAFATLVHRYLPLVYAAALRRVGGDTHRAQDVAQLVFTALARNAKALARHPDLAGWLFTTTRFLAAKTVRGEVRRQAREQAAGLTEEPMSESPLPRPPTDLQPVLDDVLMELRQIDRQVILLRFHRGLRFAEIGAQLGATENAVQKRLDRALDLLRGKLARRGVTSTATALALAFEQQGAIAVPAGLAAAATAAGLACGTGAGSLLAISTFMTLSKLQFGLAVLVVVGVSTGLFWTAHENSRLRAEVAAQVAGDAEKAAGLQDQLGQAARRAEAAEADVAVLLQAVQAAQATSPRTAAPRGLSTTREQTLEIIARIQQLEQAGKYPEALELLLSYYRQLKEKSVSGDQPMLIAQFKRLGEKFPSAIAALRTLRAEALQAYQARPEIVAPLREIATIDARLGEGQATLALHDALPAQDPGRAILAMTAQETFVAARRYADALTGLPYGSMVNMLAVATQRNETTPDPAPLREAVVATALMNIETLAGAGRANEAGNMVEKLMRYDASEATKRAVEQRLERARQPNVN